MNGFASAKPIVLVTGASGFIAGHILECLFNNGSYEIRGTVRSQPNSVKYGFLNELASKYEQTIELFQADLTSDQGWEQATAHCTYVIHTASPFPPETPKDEMEIIRPAVQGTRRVLEHAQRAGVTRVVITASTACINSGLTFEDTHGKLFSPKDWSNVELGLISPYSKSKVLAEEFAWEFVGINPRTRERCDNFNPPFELVTILPSLTIGPIWGNNVTVSNQSLQALLNNEFPMVPNIKWPLVDVRDVALAHVNALTSPQAPFNRYILSPHSIWFLEMSNILNNAYSSRGYSTPIIQMPNFVLNIVGLWDARVSLIKSQLNLEFEMDCSQTERDLNINFRTANDSILSAAESMFNANQIKARSNIVRNLVVSVIVAGFFGLFFMKFK